MYIGSRMSIEEIVTVKETAVIQVEFTEKMLRDLHYHVNTPQGRRAPSGDPYYHVNIRRFIDEVWQAYQNDR